MPFSLNENTENTMSETDKNIPMNGWDAIMQLGKQAEDAGIQDMSLEEINDIIQEVRKENSR